MVLFIIVLTIAFYVLQYSSSQAGLDSELVYEQKIESVCTQMNGLPAEQKNAALYGVGAGLSLASSNEGQVTLILNDLENCLR